MDFFYNYVVDIIMVLIFICAVLDGRRRGFVKMALSIVAFIIAALVAREFFESAGTWIYDNFLQKAALDLLTRKIEDSGIAFDTAKIAEFAAALPEELSAIAANFGTSVEGVLASAQDSAMTPGDIAQLLVDKVLSGALKTAANVLGFVAVFLACYAVLSILISAIDSIFKLPILKGINRLLGSALGAVKGMAQVVIIVLILCIAAGFMPESDFAKAVDGSRVAQRVSSAEIFQDFELSKGEGII